jgi:hypothetical protein
MNAAKHTHHDNGGAAGSWKVLSIRPPLRGATALAEMPFGKYYLQKNENNNQLFSTRRTT